MGSLGGLWIPIVAIVAWAAIFIVKSIADARVRELELHARIAMIEKGIVPPPESDPRGFDRAMRRYDRVAVRRGSGRHRRSGITLIAVGFGLMLLIGAEGNPRDAIGVGGFLVILGAAFLINSIFEPAVDAPLHRRPDVSGEPRDLPPSPPSTS
jgi:hypothetical protein